MNFFLIQFVSGFHFTSLYSAVRIPLRSLLWNRGRRIQNSRRWPGTHELSILSHGLYLLETPGGVPTGKLYWFRRGHRLPRSFLTVRFRWVVLVFGHHCCKPTLKYTTVSQSGEQFAHTPNREWLYRNYIHVCVYTHQYLQWSWMYLISLWIRNF